MQGLASGAIVGIPLLYTMEMWFHGMTLSEWHLVGVLVATLLANIVFSLLSGFRESTTLSGAVMDSVTAVGIALLFSALVLWLVGQLHADEGLADALGKVIIEAAVVSIGISFANNQVRNRSRTGEDDKDEDPEEEKKQSPEEAGEKQKKKDLQEAGAALAGSTLFALNIAPTEEVVMIASQLEPLRQLALLVAGVVFCYLILFASEFKEHEVHVPSLFQHPVSETILTCAISLAVATILLLMVGERAALSDPMTAVGCIVVLGLPAIIGGAAGRLIT